MDNTDFSFVAIKADFVSVVFLLNNTVFNLYLEKIRIKIHAGVMEIHTLDCRGTAPNKFFEGRSAPAKSPF